MDPLVTLSLLGASGVILATGLYLMYLGWPRSQDEKPDWWDKDWDAPEPKPEAPKQLHVIGGRNGR